MILMRAKNIRKKTKWIICGYESDSKGIWTLLLAANGSGKRKKIRGAL